MTFWANNPLSTDIASLLMSRGVVAHQIWPGHQSAFHLSQETANSPSISSTRSTKFFDQYIAAVGNIILW